MRLELTLPALERLIGGDTEIEVALRHQIVEAFAGHHLKSLINSEAFKAVCKRWEDQIKADLAVVMAETIESKKGEGFTGTFWSFREPIKNAAYRAAKEAIAAEMKLEEANIDRLVRRAVSQKIEDVSAELLREKFLETVGGETFTKLIEAEVERRIQERLKAAAKQAGG